LTDLAIRRFEYYFRHPSPDHNVLRPGDKAIACGNARAALGWFGINADPLIPTSEWTLFDETLKKAVQEFQIKYNHNAKDGLIGPGTRSLLIGQILHMMSPAIFERLDTPEQRSRPSVFLSYAWSDSGRVDKLDQWLRDHGFEVIRDKDSFIAGETIQENIARAVSAADKIVAILSRNSRNRDWPLFERTVAEQLESRIGSSVLVYVRLDDTKLPVHDSTRVAISARGVPLKDVGEQILRAVVGASLARPTYLYDENEPL
jgi:hypothetical protein